MTTIGASIAARDSAVPAASTPSGTAAPNATRPSFCTSQPTGGLIAGGQVAPRSADTGRASSNGLTPSNSLTRQAFPRTAANLAATATNVVTVSAHGSRTPVSRPASSSATESPSTCTPTSGASPDTSPRPSSMPNQNRPPTEAKTGDA